MYDDGASMGQCKRYLGPEGFVLLDFMGTIPVKVKSYLPYGRK